MSEQKQGDKKRKPLSSELQTMAKLERLFDAEEDGDRRQRILMWLVGRYAGPGFKASVAERSDAPSPN